MGRGQRLTPASAPEVCPPHIWVPSPQWELPCKEPQLGGLGHRRRRVPVLEAGSGGQGSGRAGSLQRLRGTIRPQLLLVRGDLGVPGLVEASPNLGLHVHLAFFTCVSPKYPFSERHQSYWLGAHRNDLTITNDIAMALLGALCPGAAPSTLANPHSSLGTPPFSLNGPRGETSQIQSQVSGAPESALSRLRKWHRFSRTP